jgi:large subunit ribosomal protein L29
MKSSEIREMSGQEQEAKIRELKETLFNLLFQHGIGQLENPQKIKQTKRDIARLKTVLRQQQASGGTHNEEVQKK